MLKCHTRIVKQAYLKNDVPKIKVDARYKNKTTKLIETRACNFIPMQIKPSSLCKLTCNTNVCLRLFQNYNHMVIVQERNVACLIAFKLSNTDFMCSSVLSGDALRLCMLEFCACNWKVAGSGHMAGRLRYLLGPCYLSYFMDSVCF